MSEANTAVEEPAEEAKAPVRLRRPERRQVAMVVQCPDDLVGPSHPVRLVMAVVEKLDVSLRRAHHGAGRASGAGRNRSATAGGTVAISVYSQIRSAGELARRCQDSAAFRWLCGGVGVNHRLLSDFRTDQGEALDELFTQVVASLVDKDVVSRVSQDGVRVRVSAGAGSFRREERLQKLLEEATRHVEECDGR